MITETTTHNKSIEKYSVQNNYQIKDNYYEDSWNEYIQILDLLKIENPEEIHNNMNKNMKEITFLLMTVSMIVYLLIMCGIFNEPMSIALMLKAIFISCLITVIMILISIEPNINNLCVVHQTNLNKIKTKVNNMNLHKYVNLDYDLLNTNKIKKHLNYNNLNFIEKINNIFYMYQVILDTETSKQLAIEMMNKNQSFNIKNLQQIKTLIKTKQKFDELGLPNHYFDNYINNKINPNNFIYQNYINELIYSFNKIKVNINKDYLFNFKENGILVTKINTIIDNNKIFKKIIIQNPTYQITKLLQEECDLIINQNNVNNTLKDVLDEIITKQDLIMNKITNQVFNNYKDTI